MVLELVAVLGLIAAVIVEGQTECPAPAAVEERLRPLLPSDQGRPADVAQLVSSPEGLRITLRRADGTSAGSRTIAGDHSCDELADAAAVMVAAWQADGTARERLPAPPPVTTVVARAASPVVVTAPGLRWELGAGAGASVSGGDVMPAALLFADVSTGGALGLGVRGLLSGNREVVLPAGSARWRRALFAVGPRVRLSGARASGRTSSRPSSTSSRRSRACPDFSAGGTNATGHRCPGGPRDVGGSRGYRADPASRAEPGPVTLAVAPAVTVAALFGCADFSVDLAADVRTRDPVRIAVLRGGPAGPG